MQILNLLHANHKQVGGAELPDPYKTFLQSFDVVNFDFVQFVPFDCIYSGGFDHADALLMQVRGRHTAFRLPVHPPHITPRPTIRRRCFHSHSWAWRYFGRA